MKKRIILIVIVLIITFTTVSTAFAEGNGPCDAKGFTYPGWFLGFWMRNAHADGKGNPYGPYWGHYQSCIQEPPKDPW